MKNVLQIKDYFSHISKSFSFLLLYNDLLALPSSSLSKFIHLSKSKYDKLGFRTATIERVVLCGPQSIGVDVTKHAQTALLQKKMSLAKLEDLSASTVMRESCVELQPTFSC